VTGPLRSPVGGLDLAIIAAYFIGMVTFGWWLSRRNMNSGDDYFLAGRSMTWPFLGSSLFSTNISSQQFIGQAGMAFAGGIAVGTFQMMGGLCFGLLALFYADTYRNLPIRTAP
jgi:SSS family solute:Na+ symporter